MSKFNVQKVESLPSPLVANTIYFVKETGQSNAQIFVTNNADPIVAINASGFKVVTGMGDFNTAINYETYYRGVFQASNRASNTNWTNVFNIRYQDSTLIAQLGVSIENKLSIRNSADSGASWSSWLDFWHSGNLDPVILRTAGNTGVGAVRYAGTTRTAGQFYGGSGSIPISNQRLNYDGDFYATSFICRTGQYIGNGDSDTASHYFKPIVDGVIYNVSSGKEHIFRVNNSNVAKITNEGVISLSGIQTGDPEGTSSALWRLGRVFDTTPTADKGIRVQIENKYYDILAEYIGEIVV
jgi:hypothetical protein